MIAQDGGEDELLLSAAAVPQDSRDLMSERQAEQRCYAALAWNTLYEALRCSLARIAHRAL
jgi:hypothetical protein